MPDAHGYQVRIVREGIEHSRYFSKKVWGGDKKAREAAVNWRDMKRASLPKVMPYLNDEQRADILVDWQETLGGLANRPKLEMPELSLFSDNFVRLDK